MEFTPIDGLQNSVFCKPMDTQNDLKRKLDLLLPHMRYIIIGSMMVVVICASILIHKVKVQYLISWAIATMLVILCRYLISRLYFSPNNNYSPLTIYKAYVISSILTGVCWGIVSGLFLQHQDIETVLLTYLIIGVVCAAAITTLSASTFAMIGYLVAAIAPASITIFNMPDPYQYQLTIGFLLLIFMLCGAARININYLTSSVNSQQQAEDKARLATNTKKRLLLSLDSTPLAYIEFSCNFKVTQWNQAATNIFGYIADDVIGHHVELFQKDKRKPQTSEESYMILFTKGINKNQTVTATNRRFDGSSIECEWHCSKLTNQQGELIGYTAYVQDISDRLKHEANIRRNASFDELTGLPNKSLLVNRMNQAISSARRYGHLCSLLYINIDNFKQINTALGPEFGDTALKEIAHRLRNKLRNEETVAKFIGNKFVVLIENLQSERSAAELAISVVAEKIIDTASRPLILHHTEFSFGASIGVTLFPSVNTTKPEIILKQAETALREVKSSTTGQFGFYDNTVNQTTLKRVKLLSGVRDALKREQFELYVQPKLDVKNNQIIGGEALVRWHHPQKGMISPGLFIGAIESSNYNFEFGEWVLKQALKMVAKWRSDGLCDKSFHLAINISPRQLLDNRFANLVSQTLLDNKLPGSCIEFEITETLLIQNFNKVNQTLQSIRAQGVQIAIDDFGTGNSSLAYISQLPLSTLKIDRSFIADISNNNHSKEAVIKAILSIGRELNLKVVAEGVENDAQLNHLKKLNCDFYQGFIFSPAVPESQFCRFLKSIEKVS